MSYEDFPAAPMLSEAFGAAKMATQPLDVGVEPMEVAVTPSQMLNGGKMPATQENADRIGLKVLG